MGKIFKLFGKLLIIIAGIGMVAIAILFVKNNLESNFLNFQSEKNPFMFIVKLVTGGIDETTESPEIFKEVMDSIMESGDADIMSLLPQLLKVMLPVLLPLVAQIIFLCVGINVAIAGLGAKSSIFKFVFRAAFLVVAFLIMNGTFVKLIEKTPTDEGGGYDGYDSNIFGNFAETTLAIVLLGLYAVGFVFIRIAKKFDKPAVSVKNK